MNVCWTSCKSSAKDSKRRRLGNFGSKTGATSKGARNLRAEALEEGRERDEGSMYSFDGFFVFVYQGFRVLGWGDC